MAQEPQKSTTATVGITNLRQIFKALGPRNDAIARTIKRIQNNGGKHYGYSAINQVINGTRYTQAVAVAFLEVAEEMQQERAAVVAKAAELVANQATA